MNKFLTKIAKAFVGLSMAIGVGVAVGTSKTVSRAEAAISDSDLDTDNATTITFSDIWGTSSNHTLSTTAEELGSTGYYIKRGGSGTATVYNSGSKHIRIYQNNTVTFSSESVNIGKIVFTNDQGSPNSWDSGSYTSGTWKADDKTTNSVAFTNTSSGSSGQWRISKIVITPVKSSDTPPTTYDISFDYGGGSSSDTPDTTTTGTVTFPTVTRDGYTLLGWKVKDGNGQPTGNLITTSTTTISEDTDFIAIWEAVYSVTYNQNKPSGASGNVDNFPSNTSAPAGSFTPSTSIPELDGYIFVGWSTNQSATAADASFTVTTNGLDLYAIWTPGKCLSFDVSSNPGNWPTANDSSLTSYTYTLNNVDYSFGLLNAKCNSGYLFVTADGVVGMPAISGYKLTKVDVTNSGGCSTSVEVGVSSSSSSGVYISGGAKITWSTQSTTYTYNLSGTISNTMYYLYVTNKNAQITNIKLTYSAGITQLDAPGQPTYNQSLQRLTWGAVEHASGYQYTVDAGSNWNNVTNSNDRYQDVSGWTDNESFTVAIRATGDGVNYSNSTAGTSLTFTKVVTPVYTSVTIVVGSLVGDTKNEAYIQCQATASGTNIPQNPTFSWYITENSTYAATSSLTGKASIDNNGKIIFEDDCTVYVWALAPDGVTHNVTLYTAQASGLLDAPGTEGNPYTVAEAREAITAGTGITGVYAKGIVSSIATAYSSQYHNISYNLSDDGTTTGAQLQAYRLAAETDPGVKVGDVIIVHGDLTLYGETYEFASGCTLTKHCQIQSISVTTSPETNYDSGDNFDPTGLVISATYNNGESNHSFSYANHGTNFSFDPSTSTSLTSSHDNVAITYGNGTANLSITVTVAPAVTGITLNPTEKVAYFEDEFSITASVTVEGGASEAITWSIEDNSSLISIKNGTATNTSVTIVAGTTSGTAYVRATSNVDNTVYARCKVVVKDPDALTDTLTRELTGISSGGGYSNWSGKSDATSAVYAGTTAGGNNSIQVNSSYGFYNTASAGYVREFVITFQGNTGTNNRVVTVYGYTTARSSIDKTGTVLGTASYNGTDSTYTITVSSDYEFEYFLLSSNNAVYLTEVLITYEKIDTTPSISLIGETSISGMEGHTDSTSLSVKVKNISSPTFDFTFDEGENTGLLTSSYISVQEGTPEDNVYPLEIQLLHPGTSVVHLNVSGQTASFTVTVTAAVPSVSFTNPTTSVLIGETVTNVATGENLGGATISYTSGNDSIATVTSAGVVTGVAKGSTTITATATVQGVDYSDSYTIRVVDAWPFVGEYILWSEGSYTASSVTYNYKTEFGGSISDNVGTESGYTFMPKGQAVLTISAASNNGEYYISYVSNGVANYLYTDTKNKLKATTDSSTEHTTWTLEEGDGGLVATNATFKDSDKDVTLQYNPSSGNGRFACYSSTQKPTWLTPFDKTAKAGAFVENYMHVEISTDDTGVDDNYQTCKGTGYYDVAKTQFNNLDDDVREEFATNSKFSDYYARLLDWAKANSDSFGSYGGEDYVLYLNKTVSLLSVTESSGTIAIIVIISMVSMTAIGGYFFLRKRKENI